MERRRACVMHLLACCCFLTFNLVTQAQGARHPPPFTYPDAPFKSSRRLTAVYDVEICRWIQDASCQLNPEYARHVLSPSLSGSDSQVREATLDEAECLAMTHEAACISRKSCEWVAHTAGNRGNTQSFCQLKERQSFLDACTVRSLRPFVKDYMRCRRQSGGTCDANNHCEAVKLSENNQGCGIDGRRVLDLLVGTSASQTEVVAHLVESATVLRGFALPRFPRHTSNNKRPHGVPLSGLRRMVLQSGGSGGSILAVDDDLPTTGGSTAEKSAITGTGTVEGGEETTTESGVPADGGSTPGSASKPNSTDPIPAPGPDASDSESAESSVGGPEKEDETAARAGSLSFNVSDYVDPDEEGPNKESGPGSEKSLETIAHSELTLNGPTRHLAEIDASVPVNLNDITEVLELLTTVMEKSPGSSTVQRSFVEVAMRLELMRFRLDSQTPRNLAEKSWNMSDSIWWSLQSTAQSLDLAYTTETPMNHTITRSTEALLIMVHEAREAWSPPSRSSDSRTLKRLESRLEVILEDRVSERPPDAESYEADIDNLDKLVSIVVDAFNETLQDMYPQKIRNFFAEKYNQTWVQLSIARNQKWCAIRELIAGRRVAGPRIVDLVQGIYRVHCPKTSASALPFLKELGDIADDLVGVSVATHADEYMITNLPERLSSAGLDIWQNGPQITTARLDDARRRAIRSLENSQYLEFEGFLSASDKVNSLLEAVIGMIDAKVPYREDDKDIPEDTAILLTMEAALNVVTHWTSFAMDNNLENKADKDPFGHPSIIDFSLSLVGCLALGSDRDGQCRNTDRSRCQIRGLRRWNSTTGMYSSSSNHTFCAPEEDAHVLSDQLFDDVKSDQRRMDLRTQITDLYFISAYCPFLAPEDCRTDERCKLYVIEDRLGCRLSSNFINYIVEANQIAGLAAPTQSCQEYLDLPVCGNLKSDTLCTEAQNCMWTQAHHHSNFNGSGEMCITDWVEQLKLAGPDNLEQDGLLTYNKQECRDQSTERECRQQNSEDTQLQGTHLPKHTRDIPRWLAFCLSVGVALLVTWLLYMVWKKYVKGSGTNVGDGRSKKGKGKKKGEQAPMPRGPPPPMFSHPLDGDSQQSNAFAFVMEAFEIENSFSTNSRSRIPSQSSRMDRFTSCTTTEISEIQPISEDEEQESSDCEESDGDEGWSSTTEEWSEEEDEVSTQELPT